MLCVVTDAVVVVVHAPLRRVPENALKFTVCLLLTTFGMFWAAEGASRGSVRVARVHGTRGDGPRRSGD